METSEKSRVVCAARNTGKNRANKHTSCFNRVRRDPSRSNRIFSFLHLHDTKVTSPTEPVSSLHFALRQPSILQRAFSKSTSMILRAPRKRASLPSLKCLRHRGATCPASVCYAVHRKWNCRIGSAIAAPLVPPWPAIRSRLVSAPAPVPARLKPLVQSVQEDRPKMAA